MIELVDFGEFVNKKSDPFERYRYIKEIVWDDEAQEKYGDSRAGFERFKKDMARSRSTNTVVDLIVITDEEGNPIRYVIKN